jgi:Family of unknown function (DUF6171)
MDYNRGMPTEEEYEANIKALQEALANKPVKEVGSQREVRPWDLLNPKQKRVDEEEKNRRLAICEKCEFFRQASRTCKKCGCFMNLKSTLSKAHCPVHKW